MTAAAPSAPLSRCLLALAIGALGGWLATLVGLPLPWMLGAMVATTVASVGGAPIALPAPLRSVMVAVLGVMLGSSFRPEILERLADWALSLSALLGYIVVAGGLSYLFFRRVAGYDRPTAYFSAMPGGFSEMVLAGGELGGDARRIALTHASRILLVVATLPFALRAALGVEAGGRPPPGDLLAGFVAYDLALLAACGLVGYLLARAVRLPAAAIVGPMVVSAAVHLGGLTVAAPPYLVVAVAQVVVGTAAGCRFADTAPALVLHTAAMAAGATAILVLGTLAFALGLAAATELPLTALTLAFAPGGLAEMSLIALALGLDAAFVATHQIVRIFLIIILAAPAFRGLKRSAAPRE